MKRATPFVVGPRTVPVVRDAEVAKRDPELAVLSVMAHGKDEPELAVQIAAAAFEACRGLDDERALLCLDLVGISLGAIARAAFQDLMGNGTYEFQSDFAKKHRAAGKEEGRAAGKEEGRAAGEATAVLTVLEARGINVADEQQARILACTELEMLDRWIRRAVTITSADDLFTE